NTTRPTSTTSAPTLASFVCGRSARRSIKSRDRIVNGCTRKRLASWKLRSRRRYTPLLKHARRNSRSCLPRWPTRSRYRTQDRARGQSALRPGDGEPYLAVSLRSRVVAHTQRLWHARRTAFASRIARLAGGRIRRAQVVDKSDAQADHDVGRVSPRIQWFAGR